MGKTSPPPKPSPPPRTPPKLPPPKFQPGAGLKSGPTTPTAPAKTGGGGSSSGNITFTDVTGRVVSVPMGSKTPEQVIAEHNVQATQQAQKEAAPVQRQIAERKVGTITRVEKVGEDITYSGPRGKYTFPVGGVSYTGATKYGGTPSVESHPSYMPIEQKRMATEIVQRQQLMQPQFEEPTMTREVKYSFGRIPERTYQEKSYEQLNPMERRSLLGFGTPEQRFEYNRAMGLNLGSPESYAKFKDIPSQRGFWQEAAYIGKGSGKLLLFPFTAGIKITKMDKAYQWVIEQSGQGFAYGIDVARQIIKPPRIEPLKMAAAFAVSPKYGIRKYGAADVSKYKQPSAYDIAISSAKKDYTTAGINYAYGVDTAISFVFPLEKALYETSKPSSKLTSYEKMKQIGLGALWSGGVKVTEYAVEKSIASKWLGKVATYAPKPAKIATWGLKGAQAAVQYGLPATYVGGSFLKINIQPTEEMKRYQAQKSSEELAYMTWGALPTGYFVGKGVQSYDAYMRSRESKFRSLNRLVRESVIKGEENFPTASTSSQAQYNLFTKETKYRFPGEKGYKGYHATTGQLPTKAALQAGSSEAPGLYISSEASIYFLKLRGEGETKIYSFGDTTLSPTLLRQQVKGFKIIPKGFKQTMTIEQMKELAPEFPFRKDYARESEFLLTKAKKGYAYVIGRKSEIEAAIPMGTQSISKGIPFYTKVPSISAAQKYEFFERRTKPEAVKRVKKFDWLSPSTYMDRLAGRKAGTFKEFGIKKGQRVPIEFRDVLAEEAKPEVKRERRKSSSEEYPYGKLSMLTASSMAYPFGKTYSSISSSKMSSKLLSSLLSRGESTRSSTSKLSSSLSSSKSSTKSSSSSLVSGVSSSISGGSSVSRGSNSISGRSSNISSIISSSRTSRISRTSSGFDKITTEEYPFDFGLRPPTQKKKKSKSYRRQKYLPSLVAVGERIYGKPAKKLTGLELRPIKIRGVY